MPNHLTRNAGGNAPLDDPDLTHAHGGHGATNGVGDPPVAAGRYALGAELARGGMGAVYRCTDANLGRDLAVKVLLADPLRRPDLARRFEAEARLTAGLQHPGVVPVHETGELPDGRPFYAMKLVRGRTLAELLVARPSPTADLPRFVDVFLAICRTVAYAHSRGVVHRDLKPANVMVGGFGEVQVMDWGLAKELTAPGDQDSMPAAPPAAVTAGPSDDTAPPDPDPDATTDHRAAGDSTDRTRAGSVMGTPAYMPPEQARGEVDRVNARSDVFALGAILCEVLTGRPPYGPGPREVVLGRAAAGDLAAARGALSASGADPELAEIAARCLAADPADRPADAGAVAGLVEAYRAGVEDRLRTAQADRAAAEATAREQAKRRRVALRLGSAVLAAVVIGGGAAAWQAVVANTARAAAEVETEKAKTAAIAEGQARIAEEKAAADAKASEAKAIKDRTSAEEVKGFMQVVFAGENPLEGTRRIHDVNKKRTVLEAMNDAAKMIDGKFGNRPEVEAEVRNTIGVTFLELGAMDAARPHLERALVLRENVLGPDHPDTLTSVHNLAVLLQDSGDRASAELLFRRALVGQEKALGPDHRSTLEAVNNLALLLEVKGDLEAAEPLYRRALAGKELTLGPNHPLTLMTVGNLGSLLRAKGDLTAAEPLARRALVGFETTLGPDHPHTLTAVGNLALLLREKGDLEAAEPLLRRALVGQEKALGPDHPETLRGVNNLASLLRAKGDLAAAGPLYMRAVAGREKVLGPDHPETVTSITNLAGFYMTMGDHKAAEPLLRRALTGSETAFGPDHSDTLATAFVLAFLLRAKGDHAAAAPLIRRVLAGKEKALGPDHPDTLKIALVLAGLHLDMRQYTDAAPLLERAARGYASRPEMVRVVPLIRLDLGLALLGAGKPDKAEALLLAGHDLLSKQKTLNAANQNRLRWVTAGLTEVYEKANQPEKAKEWRAKLAQLPPEVAPPPRKPAPAARPAA